MSNEKDQSAGDVRPLRYIVEVLRQITQTLDGFGLIDEAKQIHRARINIEAKLPDPNDIECK